jgi:hypothetical protein
MRPAKDGRVLTRERVLECGAVREVSIQNVHQLGVRDAELPASDSGYTFDGRAVERAAEGVSSDHSARAHDGNFPARCGNVHDIARSSSQST